MARPRIIHATKKGTTQPVRRPQELPGDYHSLPYLRGMRHAFLALRKHLVDLQYEDLRSLGDELCLPFLAVLLLVEGHHAPVDLNDFHQLTAWMETYELTPERVFGEEA